jgi:hypothetical protein
MVYPSPGVPSESGAGGIGAPNFRSCSAMADHHLKRHTGSGKWCVLFCAGVLIPIDQGWPRVVHQVGVGLLDR